MRIIRKEDKGCATWRTRLPRNLVVISAPYSRCMISGYGGKNRHPGSWICVHLRQRNSPNILKVRRNSIAQKAPYIARNNYP